ncbi:MAG: RHS repeat protein [Planctomycetes bacterium]|nr:RHS repeat protein [Planctomycetota bacterium]
MLSKLKYAPIVALIAFVALVQRDEPASLPHSGPPRALATSWQPEIAPAIAFVTPAAESDTVGAFTIDLAFDSAGGANIAQGSLQVRASRTVIVADTPIAAGHNLADVPGFLASISATGASSFVSQSSAGILFEPGEYTLYARISNQSGRHSDWVLRRVFVEGASPSVIKASTPVHHGDTSASVVFSGQGLDLVTEADFGAGITVHSCTASATLVTCTISVAEDAAAGPRVVWLGGGITTLVPAPQAQGIVNITYPTDRLPQGGASEARRNAAVACEGVILKNGAFTRKETDLTIEGVGLNLEFTRTYHSDVEFDGPLGQRWQSWMFQRVVYDGDIKWFTPDLKMEAFSAVAGGFVAPAGLYYKAQRAASGEVTLTVRHGTRLLFNSHGRLAYIADINQNVIECEYNHLGQLYRIIDSRGERVRLLYGADGRVETLRDRAWSDTNPRTLKYLYDGNGNLTRCRAPETAQFAGTDRLTREYHYDGQHRITHIYNPREVAHAGLPFLENDWAGGKIVAQRLGGSGAWSYLRYPANKQRRVIDPRGLRTDYLLNGKGAALTITRYSAFWAVDLASLPDHTLVAQTSPKLRSTDPDTFVEEFLYGLNGEVKRHTFPRGNRIKYEYPDPQELVSGTVSALTPSTLSDSAHNWTENEHAGHWLRVGLDASEYRYYVVVGNSATTLALGTFENLTADGFAVGAPYALFTANPDPLAQGNCLSVIRQDGPVGNQPDIVTFTTYEPRFQFPRSHTDERGYTTSYTWGYENAGADDPNECNLVALALPAVSAGQAAPQSSVWSFAYDTRGRRIRTLDPMGVATEYEYFASGEAQGFLQRIVLEPTGLAITHEYERNSVGQVIGYWPPRAHAPGAIRDSHKQSFAVNEHDQVVHCTGPLLYESGNARAEEHFIHDENGNVTARLREYVTSSGAEPEPPANPFDPGSFPRASQPMAATWIETSCVYNTRSQPVACILDVAAGNPVSRATWTLGYDDSHNCVSLTSPQGRVVERALDERNLPFTSTLAPSTAVAGLWKYDPDSNGNVTRMTDARGFGWLCEYDGFDRRTRTLDPLGNSTCFSHNAAGQLILRESRDGAQTLLARMSLDLDEQGRLWRTRQLARNAAGSEIGDGENTTTFHLDALGRTLSATDDAGNATSLTWDNASRLTKQIDAALNETTWSHDAAGGVVGRTQRDYNSSTSSFTVFASYADLDTRGNVLRVRDARFSVDLNTEASFAYDGFSQLVESRQPGRATSSEYRYDLRGLLTGMTLKPTADPHSWLATSHGFDADGLLVSRGVAEDAGAPMPAYQWTNYTRDARRQVNGIQFPGGGGLSLGHDPCGNLAWRVNEDGTLAQFTHDARGLRTHAAMTLAPGVRGNTNEHWAYDALGRIVQSTNAEGGQTLCTETFNYNTISCVESSTQNLWRRDGLHLGAYNATRTFDSRGFCTGQTFPNGREVHFTADELGRVSGVTQGSDSLADYSYTGSRIDSVVFGNGTQCEYGYDAQLLQSARLKRGAETLFGCEARRDAAGNVMAQRYAHEGNFGEVYRHDDLPRVEHDFSTEFKPVRTPYPFDNFSTELKPVRTPYPFDNFSTELKPVRTPYPFDNFSTELKPVRTPYPFDNFSTELKPVRTPYPFDNFSTELKPVQTPYPFDDFSILSEPRLLQAYQGVDLGELTALGNLPTDFALARDYTLDARSNRAGVRERAATQVVYDTPYITGANNQYTNVNGQAISGSASGRISFDASTGLYYAYDWQGRLAAEDIEGDFNAPERVYTYDARGRRVLEESFYTAGVTTRYATRALVYDDRLFPHTEVALEGAMQLGFTQYLLGPAPDNGVAPAHRLAEPEFARLPERVLHELAVSDAQTESRFRVEDALGRLMGVCNAAGRRLAEYGATDFGAPLIRSVLFDGGGLVANAQADTPVAGQTTINLVANLLVPGSLAGRELRVALESGTDRLRCATVLANSAVSIVVHDPESRFIATLGAGFVVFDFVDAALAGGAGTGGHWSAEPTASGGLTTFVDSGQVFGDRAGWLVTLNAQRGGTMAIAAASFSQLAVQGQADTLAGEGTRYRLYAPAGVNPRHGGQELNLVQRGTRCFGGTLLYDCPLAGFFDGAMVHGAQPGHARQGFALSGVWRFDPSWGRFRDPADDWPSRFER